MYLPLEAFCLMVGLSWYAVLFYRKQLLVVLLSLEFMVLSLFMGFAFVMGALDKSLSLTFYLLVLGACEASLGLCLLVVMTRYFGSDTLNLSSMC